MVKEQLPGLILHLPQPSGDCHIFLWSLLQPPLLLADQVLDLNSGAPHHNRVACFFSHPGLAIAKPDVISFLEQGKEPWVVEKTSRGGLCPGE